PPLTGESLARRLGAAARALVADRYDAHALLEAEVRFVSQASQDAPLRELFEHYADAFPIDDTLPEFVARRFDELVRARPRAVLDVGAGGGRYLGFFRSRRPGAAVRARDVRRFRDDPTHTSPLSAGRLERLLTPRFESVELEGTSLFGESRSRWIRAFKGSPFGRRLSNKLFAVCAKGE